MTFGELGLTAESVLVARSVNEAAQAVAMAANWRELEKTASITFLASGLTALPSWVRDVTAVLNASGVPLDGKDRESFDDLYRGDGTTASDPSVYCVEGLDASGNLQVSTWPVIASTKAGTVKGLRRLTVMAADGDVCELPVEMHYLVVDRAVALLREWEESEMAQTAQARADSNLGRAMAAKGQDVMSDRT